MLMNGDIIAAEGNSLPNPNCCSRRMPIKTRHNMFDSKWI